MSAHIIVKHPIPGPRAIPFVGGRANLIKLFTRPFDLLRSLHSTYGNLAGLAQGDSSYVCAFGPDLNHQLLSNSEQFEVSAGPFQKLTEDTPIGRVAARSLQLMKGDYHKQQRRLMQPAFHRHQLAAYHDDMIALTNQALARWRVGTTINLHHEMEHVTRQIVVKTLFGLDDDAATDRMGMLMQKMVSALNLALVMPFDLPGTPYHSAMRVATQLETTLRELIVRKRSQPGGNDLLTVLIQTQDEDGATLTNEELLSHTFTLFSAGHETTTSALTWTLFLLDQHPESYAALLNELESTLGGNPPSIEHLRQLPLLDGVIKESLRLLPPGVLGMRRTTAPCMLEGFALPKGANIFYSAFVTHRLPELYAEPDRFKPERWATLNPATYEYIPFSAGPHRCIAAEFAMHELKVVLATIIQRYRLAVVANAPISTNLTMRPSRGMPMSIRVQDGRFERVRVRGQIHRLVDITL